MKKNLLGKITFTLKELDLVWWLQRLQKISIKPTSFVDKRLGQFEYISIQIIGKVLISI